MSPERTVVCERATEATGWTSAASVARKPRRRLRTGLALVFLFAAAAAYHALQSRAHATPTIFIDELLYSKLAQSLAGGDGFTIRSEWIFFPAPLPALLQAPAWLGDNFSSGYELAKAWNALVMATAVFPAYWLARRLVRPVWALLAAAAAVGAPGMLYHSYLLSEALAYPVFLLAVATMVRAVQTPSPRWELAVVAATLLAVLTRTQFVLLPAAFVLAAPLSARLGGERARDGLRRHVLSVGLLVAVAGLAAVVSLRTGGAALGPYVGVFRADFSVVDALRFGGLTASLLPFAAGWLVVPGALVGLACLLARPRSRVEAAFAVIVLFAAVVLPLQAGLVAALEAERPLERYVVYLVPLAIILFAAYMERGAPHRRAYVGVALGLGAVAWLVPFPALAYDFFLFDSPTLSAYGALAAWTSHADAATVFAAVPLAGSIAVATLPSRRTMTTAIVTVSLGLALLIGAAAYEAAHQASARALRTWAGSPPHWLEQLGEEADYLALPGASPYFGWTLEAWNRNFALPYFLGTPKPRTDPFPGPQARIDANGRLVLPGRPAGRRLLVVNGYGSALELEGRVVARPRPGLAAYEVGSAPRVRSLASGLFTDGWAGPALRYQVWPGEDVTGGDYRVRLELPRGHSARRLTVGLVGGPIRAVVVGPGEVVSLEVRAEGRPIPPLVIRSDRFDYADAGTPNPRLVAVRVPELSYVAELAARR